jgi:hypothetical protein
MFEAVGTGVYAAQTAPAGNGGRASDRQCSGSLEDCSEDDEGNVVALPLIAHVKSSALISSLASMRGEEDTEVAGVLTHYLHRPKGFWLCATDETTLERRLTSECRRCFPNTGDK